MTDATRARLQQLRRYQMHAAHGGNVDAASDRHVIDGEVGDWVRADDLDAALTAEGVEPTDPTASAPHSRDSDTDTETKFWHR